MEIRSFKLLCTSIALLCFGLISLVETLPFPGIFPLLSTGWYYKPGPTESIVLGLLVVKVLALRLGATLAGVPYHLNDIFDKNILPFRKLGKRSLPDNNVGRTEPLSDEEVEALERILLALRRIDSHDCFIRYVCQVNQDHLTGNEISESDKIWLSVFRLKRLKITKHETSVWDIYDDALSSKRTNCSTKYRLIFTCTGISNVGNSRREKWVCSPKCFIDRGTSSSVGGLAESDVMHDPAPFT